MTFPVGAFQCNCTVIADTETGEAIVVDPGDECHKINAVLDQLNCKPSYLIHTHAHIDHVGASRALHLSRGGTICLHKDDEFLYQNLKMQSEMLHLDFDTNIIPVQKHINDCDAIELTHVIAEVIHTPGHTPGSVCFKVFDKKNRIQPIVFTGDTVFKNSIGRTDLWGGDSEIILKSIHEKILILPSEMELIPGHGRFTTVGQEKKMNPFLTQMISRKY